MRRLAPSPGQITLLLLAAAAGVIAQDRSWTYKPSTDPLTDVRSDEAWTEATLPASPAYRLGVTCDDTEYVAVVVRSGAAIASAASLAVRFDDRSSEALPVVHSLANPNSFNFEPAGSTLRRILASKTMTVALKDKDLQEVPVRFDVAGLSTVISQMPQKCQQRFGELAAEEKPAPKAGGRPRKAS
jgi:hypothetical protein